MSDFVTAIDVSAWLKKTVNDADVERHLTVAESMVMAYIDVTTLSERAITERHRILYDMDQDEVIETREGPISEMTSVTIGGSVSSAGADGTIVALENLVVSPWTVRRIDGEKWDKNTDVWLEFKAGYRQPDSDGSGGTMPQRIKDAIAITAGELFKSPDTQFDAERIGDYSYQRGRNFVSMTMPRIPLPDRALLLLRGFRKPASLI